MKINIELYSDLDLALMVICGYLGDGAERRQKLGHRYLPVQILVNTILHGTMPKPKNTTIDDVKRVLESMKPTDDEFNDFIKEVTEKL